MHYTYNIDITLQVKFPGLEELRISNVGGIKELWNLSDVEEEVPTFPKLFHLEVDSLPEMRSIWMSNDVIIHHIFQNLKSLTVRRCPNLEILCPLSVAAVLRQLDTLIVESNENMKEIIAKEIGGRKNNDTKMTILPKLQKIELRSLSNLKCFFDGSIKLVFPSLKSINCKDLNEMVAFVSPGDSGALFNDKVKFPGLEELRISNVGGIKELWNLSDVEEEVPTFPKLVHLEVDNLSEMRSIWMSNDVIIYHIFQNLKNLTVRRCPNLEILCPLSVAAVLRQLDTLIVESNENMKEIIAKETGELKNNDTGMTVFPKLRNMELQSLSNLKCFFGGSVKLVFPSLESIDFLKLDKMVTFVNSEYPRDSNALFNDKVALPAIKKIHISGVNGPKEIWGSHLDAGSFNELKSLVVFYGQKEATKVFSLDAIRQMRNLKKLDIYGFQLAKEFIEHAGFYNDGVENSALLLPQLRKLTMDSFPLLKRIPWRELALQNLRYLKICQVEGLTYLFPASVGRRLVNLEELDVSDCQMMEEIVGGESGDTNTVEVNIVFPHLNILRLHNLPALRSLSSDNVIIEFPSIIEVDFQQFQNPILLDLLQKFQHVKELILGRCEALLEPFDLERRASAIPPRLGKLTLSNMSKLQMIPWKIFPIENLHYLKISQIDGLKFLFPASLGSKGFAQLEEIRIEYCKDIEHVLAQESNEDTSNNPAPIKVVLPRIYECVRVKTFSYGSLSTPRLRHIHINWNFENKHLDLNAVIKNRIEEETSGEDTKTQSIEEETSQGDLLYRKRKKKMSKDAETKFIEGETSQRIEEETSGEDTETQSIEEETRQWKGKNKMLKDIEAKFIEGETSRRIEEVTSGEDTETQSIEGETSQGVSLYRKGKKKMLKDIEAKFIEGETSRRIEEVTSGEDTETQSIEGETSQGVLLYRKGKNKMLKDIEAKFIEGETSRRIEEVTSGEDTETQSIEEETSQGVLLYRKGKKKMLKDIEAKFKEGETSRRIEEVTIGEDTEKQSIEEETSQRKGKKKMSKDAETKFVEGETSQRIEEETSGEDTETQNIEGETSQGKQNKKISKDAETKFIEGETSQRIEEETNEEDTKTQSIEEETSQGDLLYRKRKKKMSKDAETKFIEGETSQRIKEETSGEDTETQSIEEETSQWKQKKKMSKDAETKFIEGETSQRIEEETSGEDTETQNIEGEISQGVEEETSRKDTEIEITWWRRKFEVYDQYFENWTELFGLILYPLLRALVIILMIWIFIRAFKIDADPSTKSKANSNPLFKGNEL
ncbi:hypothetical protein Nepgr_033909 [Nepenthes gracilis]|uniref:Disease resistance protein At4g27190-like leucine-rich repeats domain-containing protein n=1 Tax=Nepenthes gracilis TaxID=150966 RepID=A0AAD3TM01_NEPGR|nr:hypothetical protein Nepgr_033909 [Nepenthes gracilis]